MTSGRRNQRWEELDRSSIPLSKLIKHYEAFNRTEGKSPRTIEWYTETLLAFEKFLQNSNRSRSLRDIGIEEAREFILYLQQITYRSHRISSTFPAGIRSSRGYLLCPSNSSQSFSKSSGYFLDLPLYVASRVKKEVKKDSGILSISTGNL